MRDFFDRETPPELREQILRYAMSSVLTDVERARLLGLPASCRIREGAKIIAPEHLTCGENVWIGEGCLLDASGGLTIGSNVSIGPGAKIYTHSSLWLSLRGRNTKANRGEIQRKPVVIGDNCFVGTNAVILMGVTIGRNAVIQPLSLVDRDVPAKAVVDQGRELRELREDVARLERALSELRATLEARAR